MKVTLQQIAELSGFSITTVSRALAGYSDVSEQTRQKIQALADELGYVPNQIARSLQSQRANAIGMVLPLDEDFSSSFFMELVASVAQALAHYHYDLLLAAQLPGEYEMADYQRLVTASRVDGMIVARTLVNDPRIAYLQQRNFPFVVLGRDGSTDHPFIDVDGYSGFYRLTEHFIKLGHQRIGIINGPEIFAFARRRFEGYKQALMDHQILFDPELVVEGDLSQISGIRCANQLLNLHPDITALVACNDIMALGAMQAIQQHGWRIGDDIAVGGFDDIALARSSHPPLTTLRQPVIELGRHLVEILLALVLEKPIDCTQILIEPELIIRDSSGAIRL